MFTQQGMGQGPRTLDLRQDGPCVQRGPTGRAIIVIVIERVIESEEREREMSRERKRKTHERRETRRETQEERDTRSEGEMESEEVTFNTLLCVRSHRSRVYLQNARVTSLFSSPLLTTPQQHTTTTQQTAGTPGQLISARSEHFANQ